MLGRVMKLLKKSDKPNLKREVPQAEENVSIDDKLHDLLKIKNPSAEERCEIKRLRMELAK